MAADHRPQRWACPSNGEPRRCEVCRIMRTHRREEWAVSGAHCNDHKVDMVLWRDG